MKIGELAELTGTPVETIRFYEREGVLPKAGRSQSNYRMYDSSHVARLAFIRHCRTLDMTLAEIRALLKFKDSPEDNCAEVNILLDEHIGHVAERIRELRLLDRQLQALRAMCDDVRDSAHCGILNELSNRLPLTESNRRHAGHVSGTHGGSGRRRRAA
jgi:Cd(II)/Pb(II)-responsive transcriptional regulator